MRTSETWLMLLTKTSYNRFNRQCWAAWAVLGSDSKALRYQAAMVPSMLPVLHYKSCSKSRTTTFREVRDSRRN
jgi:hypothetical protein